MPGTNLFLKRSQTTSNNGGGGTRSSNNKRNQHIHGMNRGRMAPPPPPKQGSEAIAVESQQVNAKMFHYPSQGFVTPIEHTLLYTMIRESTIFPPETVLEAIDNEDYTQYFYLNEEEQKRNVNITQQSLNKTQTNNVSTRNHNISYAQLTAMLALAGEEWSESTKVPERLCQTISKQIVKYATRHDLDRSQELKELIDPLLEYAKKSRTKQSLQMLPWFAAITVSAINPLAFYTTYMTMIAVNGENMAKRDMADRNTFDFVDLSNRKANVEKASLLEEDYNDDDDDHS